MHDVHGGDNRSAASPTGERAARKPLYCRSVNTAHYCRQAAAEGQGERLRKIRWLRYRIFRLRCLMHIHPYVFWAIRIGGYAVNCLYLSVYCHCNGSVFWLYHTFFCPPVIFDSCVLLLVSFRLFGCPFPTAEIRGVCLFFCASSLPVAPGLFPCHLCPFGCLCLPVSDASS